MNAEYAKIKQIRQIVTLFFLAVIMGACAANQSSSSGYQNEVGANGLPTPRALYARYVDVLGGEARLRANTSRTARGSFELSAMGLLGEVTIYAAAPNKVSQVIELPGVGTIVSGYNGDIGWSIDPLQGSNRLEGEAAQSIADQADYYLPLNLATIFPESETVGTVNVMGGEAYQVDTLNQIGQAGAMYFSAESGLLVRQDSIAVTPFGELEVLTFLEEYADFNGVKSPSRIIVEQAGQEIIMTINEATFNDVDDSRFDVPAGI